jgi:hypothetical protein
LADAPLRARLDGVSSPVQVMASRARSRSIRPRPGCRNGNHPDRPDRVPVLQRSGRVAPRPARIRTVAGISVRASSQTSARGDRIPLRAGPAGSGLTRIHRAAVSGGLSGTTRAGPAQRRLDPARSGPARLDPARSGPARSGGRGPARSRPGTVGRSRPGTVGSGTVGSTMLGPARGSGAIESRAVGSCPVGSSPLVQALAGCSPCGSGDPGEAVRPDRPAPDGAVVFRRGGCVPLRW